MSRVTGSLLIPIVIGLIFLAGCFPVPADPHIPVPVGIGAVIPADHATRVDGSIGGAVDTNIPIQIGVTTKEEVLARVPEKPERIFEDKRIIAYHWMYAHWKIVGVGIWGTSTQYDDIRDRLLLIQFDASDRVSRAEWLSKDWNWGYPRPFDWDFVDSWSDGDTDGYSVLYNVPGSHVRSDPEPTTTDGTYKAKGKAEPFVSCQKPTLIVTLKGPLAEGSLSELPLGEQTSVVIGTMAPSNIVTLNFSSEDSNRFSGRAEGTLKDGVLAIEFKTKTVHPCTYAFKLRRNLGLGPPPWPRGA